MPHTALADIIVPDVFAPYTQTLSEEKSRLIQSGAMMRDPVMDGLLAGGGKTFDLPSWDDLDGDDAENVSTTNDSVAAVSNIGSHQQVGVRLARNKAWGSYDLASELAGSDPLNAIEQRTANYWAIRWQKATIATQRGVNRDNAVNDGGDYAIDVAAAAFAAGVTNFTAEAFIDAKTTLGDSMDDVSVLLVHSIVYSRMSKNNLIDFIPDARGETQIATFQGAEVIVDDGLPSGAAVTRDDGTDGVAGIYESWLVGPGYFHLGVGSPRVPVEVDREPGQGDGGGRETLHTRQTAMIHPSGHAYVGTGSTAGGPPNTAADDSTGALDRGASWNRVYPQRKQVKFARLITRES